ncbi:MAG: VWA containing CoxE family protein, partial [Leptospira sp.]|nr:VWA containing CoxE family protein [Leptospira sp.]
KGITDDPEFKKKIEEWLNSAIEQELSDERKTNALHIPPEDLMRELEKRLREQKERHDGGNYWIGTGGTSPFGNSGFNPNGIRIGGESGGKSAISIAEERRYADYRTDETLNVRQIKVALKNIRDLRKQGRPDISIPKTIDGTCKNAGDIDIVFEKSRKNNMKLLLLMDVGGSMTPHAERVSKLFSAGHQLNHFKEFHYYYFHNIMYDYVYKDASMRNRISVEYLLNKLKPDTRVIFVGDAYMAPYELMNRPFTYDYVYGRSAKNQKPASEPKSGFERLSQLTHFFKYSVWLNPENRKYWNAPTIEMIRKEIPMFFLSVDGLKQGVRKLVG